MLTLQDLTGNTGKLSQMFIKADKPANIPAVLAELKELLPDYNIYTMEEFTSLFTVEAVQGGALRNFIDVMVAIGVVIGFAVALLSMRGRAAADARDRHLEGAGSFSVVHPESDPGRGRGHGNRRNYSGHRSEFSRPRVDTGVISRVVGSMITPEWWPIAGAISLVVRASVLSISACAARQDPGRGARL